jgi:cobalt-zinc-cadmium efflux system outer membrane protein
MRHRLVIALIALFPACTGCGPLGVHRGAEHVTREIARRTGHAAAPVRLAAHVTEDELVRLALARNADFAEALAETGFTLADLEAARQLPNPVLSLLFPIGPKQLEITARQTLDALRLRGRRTRIAELDAWRVAERLVQTGLDLIRDVRLAVVELAVAREREAVAREAMITQRRIARLAAARLESGDASRLEVAQADAEEARLAGEPVRQRAARDVALVRLRALVGIADGPDANATEALESVSPRVSTGAPPPVETLVARALAARPDARATEIALEAAGQRAGLAAKEAFGLVAIADVNASDERFEIGPGADLTLPLVNRNEAGRARARAEIARATAQRRSVRIRIDREVREAHARCVRAAELVATQRDVALPAARAAERAAERANDIGESSLFAVLDARRQTLDARVRVLDAEADLARARAELERAVSERVPELGAEPARRAD